MSVRTFLRRVVAALQRRRLDDELREEMAAHIEARRDDLIAGGMDAREAAAAARRQFGNVTVIAERTGEARGLPGLESFVRDLHYGLRLLVRAPLFASIAVLSIAFGLAGALTMFTVVNAMVLRPVTAGASDVFRVFTSDREGSGLGSSSFADYRDFAGARAFEQTCAMDDVRATMTAAGVSSVHDGVVMGGGCFDLLRLRPHAGRLPSAPLAGEAVISYALWRRAFAADPAAVGAGVRFNGVPAMIVGIAPPGFSGTSLDGSADFWLSAEGFSQLLPSRALTDRRHRSFTILGRLAAGVSAGAAEARLAGIAASLARIDPQAWTDATGATRRVTVMKETDARFASSPGAIPALLGGATAAIVAIVGIACINIATLLLARGAARTRELTIRLAIGASRGRLLRQLATESLVIAILGTAVALAVVSAGIRIFAAYRPEGVPAVDLAVDWRVVLFAATAASLATILCGLLPAAHLVRLAVAEGLKGRAAAVRTRWLRAGAREALIVVQVTASVALLLASAVFTHGLSTGRAASPGFVTEGIVTMAVDLGNAATDARGASRRLIAAVERVAGPGATAVGAVIPLTGTAISAEITGAGIGSRVVDGNVVSPGYLPMLGIALRRGRDFSERDTGSAPGVVIVNETLARALWRSIDVVGRSFTLSGRPVEVVGVAADTRYRSVSQPFPPLVYSPLEQVPRQRFIIHLRTTGGPQVISAIEAAARAVDARIMIDGAVPIEKRLQDVRVAERLATLGGAAGGAIQFGLVLMAVWALVAYAVERRTHEIGVRRALGAPERSVVAMLLKPAVLLISAGAVLGTCAGWTAASVLQSEFVGLAPLELSAGLPAIAAMLVVAVAAAWLPARRAAQVDPIAALRAD